MTSLGYILALVGIGVLGGITIAASSVVINYILTGGK